MTRLRDRNINTDVHHFQILKKNTYYPASDTQANRGDSARYIDDVASGITPGYPRMRCPLYWTSFYCQLHTKIDHLEFPRDILF